MNPANFKRLITCLESDWAQSRPLNPLKALQMLVAKDNAERGTQLNSCGWLGFNQDDPASRAKSREVFDLLFCPWEDARDKMVGKAAALREFCHANGVQIGEVAA